MEQQDEIFDSPTGWVANHIHSYIETDGQKGHQWHGSPTLLLTTRGRKSGLLQSSAVKCEQLMTVDQKLIVRVIGRLSASLMAEVDACLKTSLALS